MLASLPPYDFCDLWHGDLRKGDYKNRNTRLRSSCDDWCVSKNSQLLGQPKLISHTRLSRTDSRLLGTVVAHRSEWNLRLKINTREKFLRALDTRGKLIFLNAHTRNSRDSSSVISRLSLGKSCDEITGIRPDCRSMMSFICENLILSQGLWVNFLSFKLQSSRCPHSSGAFRRMSPVWSILALKFIWFGHAHNFYDFHHTLWSM